jgi:ribonucleoside-triphosphate reductase
MLNEKTHQFAVDVLNHMRGRLIGYQEKYGALFNLEATPAESTAYRLAKHDVERYPDIITAAKPGDTPYYTNSSHLPVGATDDIFEALDSQDKLQTLYTSGTVFHAFLGESISDWKSAAALVRKIAENYRLPTYTISPTYSVCRNHGYISGEHFICPKCGEGAEVYSRITGYYRPVQNWNAGKLQEYKDRREYDPAKTTAASENGENENIKLILFTTTTCVNCNLAKKMLDAAGMAYTPVDAADHQDQVTRYGVRQAPTLVAVSSGSMEIIPGIDRIRTYIRKG